MYTGGYVFGGGGGCGRGRLGSGVVEWVTVGTECVRVSVFGEGIQGGVVFV